MNLNLLLYDQESAISPGHFICRARDGSHYSDLYGSPSGQLVWKGANIARSVNGIGADANGNVALPITPTFAYYIPSTRGAGWQIQAPGGGTYAFLIITVDLTIRCRGTVAGGTLMTQPAYHFDQNDVGIFWRVA